MIYNERINKMVDMYSNLVGVICGEKEFTYQEINDISNSIVHGLYDLGLEKGDKIALLSRNCEIYRELLWAAGKGGFVLVPVNARLMPKEILYVINDSEAKILITSKEYLDVLGGIKGDLPKTKHFFSIDPGMDGYIYLKDFLKKNSKDNPQIELKDDDYLFFQYTSGTTGLPKGAIHTQGTTSCIIEMSELRRSENENNSSVEAGSYVLHILPLYSFAGTAFDISYQWRGLPTVILEKFDPSEMMRLIEKYRIAELHIVPVILSLIFNSPDFGKYDLSSLKMITYGGAPIAPVLLKKGIEKFGNIFVQDYGASEAGGITILPTEDHVVDGPPDKVKRLSSCGKPMLGVDVKILNERGEEVKPGEIGEVTIKSPMIMRGYWNLADETEKVLKNGRFYTGDLGTVDEDGYIYLKDRSKDLIITGGFNVYPQEIESVLLEHPAILDVAVIGIPDDIWGESVCALVALKEGKQAKEEEIIDYVKSKIASYKKPKKVEFVDAIPRTLSGKILKKDLRRKYWEGKERKV